MAPHSCFGARDGCGRPSIVKRAVLTQALNGRADGGRRIAPIGQPGSNLCFRKLPRREPSERAEVGSFG